MGKAIVGEELPKEVPEPESKSDSLLKELDEIRRRRTDGDRRSIFAKKENPVLFVGVVYGILYGALILSMSSGMLGQSTAMDHSASNTFLDIGEDPCNEVDDEPWIHIFPNEDAEVFSLNVYNLPAGYVVLTYNIVEEGTSSSSNATESIRALDDENNRAHAKADYSSLDEGNYVVSLTVEMYETREDAENDSLVSYISTVSETT